MIDERFEAGKTQKGKSYMAPKAGAVFGGLTVLGPGATTKGGKSRWLVRCKCGREYSARLHTIVECQTGCRPCSDNQPFVDEVFKGNRKLYTSLGKRYRSMVDRCHKPEHPAYDRYGARGITVWEPWKADMFSYLRYVAELPGFDVTGATPFDIDRIDNNGGYEPGNIRCTSRQQNNRNRRDNVGVVYEGRSYCLKEFMGDFCPKLPVGSHAYVYRKYKSPTAILAYYKGRFGNEEAGV